MTREIRVNEDLRGVTLTGSFMYVGNCTFGEKGGKLTTFIRDCTAADFINNDGPADYSQADLYAAQWRGNKNMGGSLWPANIGYLHHEPVGDIINEGAKAFPPALQTVLQSVGAFVLSDYVVASWYSTPALWWDGATKKERDERVEAWRKIFQPYSQLAAYFEELLRDLIANKASFTPLSLSREIDLPDGTKKSIDALNLPALIRPLDRVELGAKIHPDLFLYSIIPPVPYFGDWKTYRRAGW